MARKNMSAACTSLCQAVHAGSSSWVIRSKVMSHRPSGVLENSLAGSSLGVRTAIWFAYRRAKRAHSPRYLSPCTRVRDRLQKSALSEVAISVITVPGTLQLREVMQHCAPLLSRTDVQLET